MKITDSDYTELKNRMEEVINNLPSGRLDYFKGEFERIAKEKNLNADKMLAWEIYHATRMNLYHYLNDSHIETAIMRIMKELTIPEDTMNTKKHYIVMNGSIGCLPDNMEVHDTKESAIESILSLFNDYEDTEELHREMNETGIYYFPIPPDVGADYVEIVEEPCIGIENGCEYCEDQYNAMMAD